MNERVPKTWNDFILDTQFCTFEDPIHVGCIERRSFIEIYEPVLKTFDGSDMSSYIDFYFKVSVLNDSHLVFVDEDAKLDFFDFAQELHLIPTFKEISEGENKDDKQKRKGINKEDASGKVSSEKEFIEKFGRKVGQTKKSLVKKEISSSSKEEIILDQKKKSINVLEQKLKLENDETRIQSLLNKINRIKLSIKNK